MAQRDEGNKRKGLSVSPGRAWRWDGIYSNSQNLVKLARGSQMSCVFHQESISVRPWADLKVKWRHFSALDNFFDSSHHPCGTLSSRSPALSVMLRWIGHRRVDWLLECGVGDPSAAQRWIEGFFCQPKPFTLWSSSILCSWPRGKKKI